VGAYQANNNNPGKSYVVFGKTNGCAINLSAIADASNPLGGFVINGEAKYDYCHLGQPDRHPQSNHPSHRH
jgi:hypothetical protein